jgi:hypothetical protein
MKRTLLLALALMLCSLSFQPAAAQGNALVKFELITGGQELMPGMTVIASWQTRAPVKRISLFAATIDGPLAPLQPNVISTTFNAARTAGQIAFVLKPDGFAFSPLIIAPRIDGVAYLGSRVRMRCDKPWFFAPRVERCPQFATQTVPATFQRFQRGVVFRYALDNKAIVDVLYDETSERDARSWQRFDDQWSPNQPETDPAIRAPEGLLQPTQGIGLIWRGKPNVRFRLGWATGEAQAFLACISSSWGGGNSLKIYTLDPANSLYELDLNPRPSAWRILNEINGEPVKITACG